MSQLEFYHPYSFILSSTYMARYSIAYMFIACVVMGALTLTLYSVYKTRKQRQNNAAQRALQAIQAIQHTQDYKLFCFELCAVIKWYCVQRYQNLVTSLSDHELLIALKKSNEFSEDLYQDIEQLITCMHVVKFFNDYKQLYPKQILTQRAHDFITTSWGLDKGAILKELKP